MQVRILQWIYFFMATTGLVLTIRGFSWKGVIRRVIEIAEALGEFDFSRSKERKDMAQDWIEETLCTKTGGCLIIISLIASMIDQNMKLKVPIPLGISSILLFFVPILLGTIAGYSLYRYVKYKAKEKMDSTTSRAEKET